jgi:hypothetical protein
MQAHMPTYASEKCIPLLYSIKLPYLYELELINTKYIKSRKASNLCNLLIIIIKCQR